MLFAVADQPFSQVKLSLMGPIKYISRAPSPSLNKHLQPPPPSPKVCRVVTKILSCQENTRSTGRQGIKQLGVSFGFVFLLYFSFESSWGAHS